MLNLWRRAVMGNQSKGLKPSEGLAFSVSNNEATLTGIGTCTDTDIVIPTTYNGYPVLYIAQSAFRGNQNITSVIIQDGITTIYDYAFYQCPNLNSVSIAGTVLNTGRYAFSNNISLTDVEIKEGVLETGAASFKGDTALTEITLPASLTEVSGYTFDNCSNLSTITSLATTPPTVGYAAFSSVNLQHIYVPAESVNVYKSASGWSAYATKISAIPA